MTHSSLPNRASNDETTRSDAGAHPSFSQIMRLILRRWYWFALSFVLFVVLGKVIVNHRPIGRQTYYMQLSSRQPHELTNPMLSLGDSTLKTSPWTPEYIAALLNTTTAVIDAGKRINFQVNYSVKTPLGLRDYYNQTPIIVHFDDLLQTDNVSCVAQLDDPVNPRQVTLSAFSGVAQGVNVNAPYDVVIPVGTTQETPIGRISVTLDNPAEHYPYHIDQKYRKISITYTSLAEARRTYETEMQVTMKKADLPLSSVIRVDMLSNRAERRCLDLLYEMYLVTDSLGWLEQLSDETGDSSALLAGATVPPVGVSPFRLIDEPRIKKEMQPDLFILAGMGLLGLLLPLLIMYIYWVVRGVIYYVTELPSLLRNRLRLDIRSIRRGKQLQYPNLEELCDIVYSQGEQRTIQLTTPNEVKAHSLLISELQEALQQRGISCGVWHLDLTDKKESSEPKGSVYHTPITPGLLTSAPFQQQLQNLQEQHQLLIIVAPALTKDPSAYLLSSRVADTFYCIYKGATSIRAIRQVVNQLQIRQHLDLSRLYTLWIE